MRLPCLFLGPSDLPNNKRRRVSLDPTNISQLCRSGRRTKSIKVAAETFDDGTISKRALYLNISADSL
ncbi:Uncharacterised protein [Porphyromonas cangingivalis]|nr:Uncharacterised protein [Porphyromonas cangingivalis]